MDWKKEAEKIREVMLEHKRKLESDPEYRKRCEDRQKLLFDENCPGYWKLKK